MSKPRSLDPPRPAFDTERFPCKEIDHRLNPSIVETGGKKYLHFGPHLLDNFPKLKPYSTCTKT